MGTLISLICPEDPAGRTSLNLLVQEIPDEVTLEDYTSQSLQQMQALSGGEGWKVWDEKLLGLSGKRMQFAISAGAPVPMKLFQAWTVQEGKAFIVTFSSPADTHDGHRTTVETILGSLKFAAKADPQEKPIENLCMVHFENEKNLFRLRYPRSWKAIQPKAGPVVQFQYQDVLSARDPTVFKLSVDVMVTPLPDASWTLDRYSEIASLRLQDILGEEAEIPNKEKVSLGGQEAYAVRYNSDSIERGGKFVQTYTVKDGKVFIITTMATTPEKDKRPYPVFDRILASFEFLSPGYTSKTHLFVYEHLIHKVSFEFSGDFTICDGFMMTLVSFEHGHSDDQGFRSNVNLVLSDVPDTADLAAFTELVHQQLQSAIDDLDISAETACTLGGLPAREIRYSGKIAQREFSFCNALR